MTKGKKKSKEHYQATCNYCKKFWENGKSHLLCLHLANQCIQCPEKVVNYFARIITENILSSEDESFNNQPQSKNQKHNPN